MLGVQRHLIPGLLQEHGLGEGQLVFPPDALQLIADGYTREASQGEFRNKLRNSSL